MHISELNLTYTFLYDVTQNISQNLCVMKPYISGDPPPPGPDYGLAAYAPAELCSESRAAPVQCAPVCLACCGVSSNAWRRE